MFLFISCSALAWKGQSHVALHKHHCLQRTVLYIVVMFLIWSARTSSHSHQMLQWWYHSTITSLMSMPSTVVSLVRSGLCLPSSRYLHLCASVFICSLLLDLSIVSCGLSSDDVGVYQNHFLRNIMSSSIYSCLAAIVFIDWILRYLHSAWRRCYSNLKLCYVWAL